MCGKEVLYEQPFNDYSTRRVPCGRSCQNVSPSRTPEVSNGKLSEVMFPSPIPPRVIGVLGH